MSNYQQYPTPPPTSSPKHSTVAYHNFSPKLHAQDSYYQETQPEQTGPKLAAQDTYYKQSYSTPVSPFSAPPPEEPIATTTATSYEYLPPRRKSSPGPQQLPSKSPTNPYYTANPPSAPYQNTQPLPRTSRPSSRTKTRTPPPRPLYFSPTNPIPTPYNTSRPLPRPGFFSRILAKLNSLLQRLAKWARNNPIKAGIATFLPILAGAGLVRAGKALGMGKAFAGIGKVLSSVTGGVMESMGGGKPPGSGDEPGAGRKGGLKKGLEKEVEKEAKEFGWGMDHFVGFGGTKNGPLDGIMKVLMMGVNHYCKLSPSAVPRAASVLLELYFLEHMK